MRLYNRKKKSWLWKKHHDTIYHIELRNLGEMDYEKGMENNFIFFEYSYIEKNVTFPILLGIQTLNISLFKLQATEPKNKQTKNPKNPSGELCSSQSLLTIWLVLPCLHLFHSGSC